MLKTEDLNPVLNPVIDADCAEKLSLIEQEFKEGDITLKGYWKKKCSLLDNFLPDAIKRQMEDLAKELKEADITEKGYYKKLEEIIEGFLKNTLNKCNGTNGHCDVLSDTASLKPAGTAGSALLNGSSGSKALSPSGSSSGCSKTRSSDSSSQSGSSGGKALSPSGSSSGCSKTRSSDSSSQSGSSVSKTLSQFAFNPKPETDSAQKIAAEETTEVQLK
ncbi:secreted protein C-like [Physella acuta]|uniref:secreted protein C-like n=1 Tax=Physella acuta TaxID=109671 RepID=UPI0027DC7E1E|nr:secreted protein C-like [Physella acuta]